MRGDSGAGMAHPGGGCGRPPAGRLRVAGQTGSPARRRRDLHGLVGPWRQLSGRGEGPAGCSSAARGERGPVALGLPGAGTSRRRRPAAPTTTMLPARSGTGASAYITGVDFQPGNAAIVHHAILYRVTPARSPTRKPRTPPPGARAGPHSRMTRACRPERRQSGGGLDPGALASRGGRPGTGGQLFGKGLGVALAAGSRIVLRSTTTSGPDTDRPQHRPAGAGPRDRASQAVAHDAARRSGGARCAPDRDRSALQPVQRRAPRPRQPLRRGRGGDGRGAPAAVRGTSFTDPRAGPTQSCDRRVTASAAASSRSPGICIFSAVDHHRAQPGHPAGEVLFDPPVWNFDDQRAEALPTPVAIGPGDVLRVSCTHDAACAKLP